MAVIWDGIGTVVDVIWDGFVAVDGLELHAGDMSTPPTATTVIVAAPAVAAAFAMLSRMRGHESAAEIQQAAADASRSVAEAAAEAAGVGPSTLVDNATRLATLSIRDAPGSDAEWVEMIELEERLGVAPRSPPPTDIASSGDDAEISELITAQEARFGQSETTRAQPTVRATWVRLCI